MKRARLLDKMPTVMEMTEAVTDSSCWLQVLLLGLTSDLQVGSELPLADMVEIKSKGERERETSDYFFLPTCLKKSGERFTLKVMTSARAHSFTGLDL